MENVAIRCISFTLIMFLTMCQSLAQANALRPRHHQRPHHRWHRLSLVFRRRWHPRWQNRRHRQSRDRAARSARSTPRQGRRSWLHRHARPVRTHHSGRSAPAVENLPGDHHRNHWRRRVRRAAERRVIQADRLATSTTTSRPTGAPSASISRGWKNKASASTWQAMSARPRCAVWCSATTNVQPMPKQLEQMKALVGDAMKDGAVGVSTALQYAPAPYAKTEELIALATEAASSVASMPLTCATKAMPMLAAIDEAIRIGREAHIPVEIWHLKAAGKDNWGRMPEIVAQNQTPRAPPASDISANTYAYPPGSTPSPRSFRRGRTMAATQNWSSASKTRPRARASARTC